MSNKTKRDYIIYQNKENVLQFLNSLLKPKKSEKKQYGEVFTPLKLVDYMLDMLRKKNGKILI